MPIAFKVPGKRDYFLENVIFDLNGTLAVDGQISPGTCKLLRQLSEKVNIFVLTADTQGTALTVQTDLGPNIKLKTISGENTTASKYNFIKKLGPANTAAVGNGANDVKMLQEAVLSIALLGKEGCSTGALSSSDIVVNDIDDAIKLFIYPKRIIATLRS